jgi:hypothetical protein
MVQVYLESANTAFEGAMGAGQEPAVAMDAALDAVGAQMATDGFNPNVIETMSNGAVETFNQVMEGGGEPNEAFSSASEAGIVAGQQQFNDDMPDLDQIGSEAFAAAIEGGSSPADAAAIAGGAVAQAAGEAGIPPEVLEAGMAAATNAFETAIAAGEDPQAAFDGAMEAGGNAAEGVLNEAGITFDDGADGESIANVPAPGMDAGGPGMEAGGPGMEAGGPGMEAGGPGMEAGGVEAAQAAGANAGDALAHAGTASPSYPVFGSEEALEGGGAEAAGAAAGAAAQAAAVAHGESPEAADNFAEAVPAGPNFDAINAEVQSVEPVVDNGPAPLDNDPTEAEVVPEAVEVVDEVDPLT